jgi:hypothetical protein
VGGVDDIVDLPVVVGGRDDCDALPVALVLVADAELHRLLTVAAHPRRGAREMVEAQEPPVVDVEAIVGLCDVVVDRRSSARPAVLERRTPLRAVVVANLGSCEVHVGCRPARLPREPGEIGSAENRLARLARSSLAKRARPLVEEVRDVQRPPKLALIELEPGSKANRQIARGRVVHLRKRLNVARAGLRQPVLEVKPKDDAAAKDGAEHEHSAESENSLHDSGHPVR